MNVNDIKTPKDIKNLTYKELEVLCKEIREHIIHAVSENGGHLSANLGAVEFSVALHYVFDSPHDKFIFDVGHQSYVHKILTGRASQFDRLRKKNGLSGYINYSESEHDVWEAGHSSTALSAAAGFLEAKEAGADIGEIIAVVGDGSIQNGLSFEGLNYIGSQKKQKAIIIINDNDMSISKNVGRLAKSMNKIRIRKTYAFFKRVTPKWIHRIFRNLKDALKIYVYGNNVFTAMDYKYYGPIDGNNLREVIRYFEFAKQTKSSVVLHLKTRKGKGYDYAEVDENGSWHGVGPFDIQTGKTKHPLSENEISWSAGISDMLIHAAKQNDHLRIISPAMISGAALETFKNLFPNRIIDVGIAEEHAVVMAAAMARFQFIPIVSIYSTFLQRAYDQINHDVCRTNAHVIFLVDRAGLVPGDGSTHQGIFDVSCLSALPNMVIVAPSDLTLAYQALLFAVNHHGPVAIRYPKETTMKTAYMGNALQLGKWIEELPLQAVNIITYGNDIPIYKEALKNRGVGLVNALFIKPLDTVMLDRLRGKKVIIVEDIIKNGSLGAVISAYNSQNQLEMIIQCHSIDDCYIETGTIRELKQELELDVESILKKI